MTLFHANKLTLDKLHELGLPKNLTALKINIQAGEPIEYICSYYPTDKEGKTILDYINGQILHEQHTFVLKTKDEKEQNEILPS